MRTLKDRAYTAFKQRLLANDLTPGQFVTQRELAGLLGVPLGPMREALFRLEAEALVRLIPQRGIHIAEINVELIKDAFQMRTILEKEAARSFAVHGDPAHLEPVAAATEEVLAGIEMPLDEQRIAHILEVDWLLHDTLVDAMGNAIISHTHHINGDKIRLMRHRRRFTNVQLREAMEEHLAVIEALRAREPEAAATAIEGHLRMALRRGLGIL